MRGGRAGAPMDPLMDSSNPYAPPQAHVRDVEDPSAPLTHAERGTRLVAAILDQVIATAVVMPFLTAFFVGVATGQVGDAGLTSAMATGAFVTVVAGAIWCWLTIRFVLANGQSIGK